MTLNRKFVTVLLVAGTLIAIWIFVGRESCPASGIAFTEERRNLHRLKNRTSAPQPTDFNMSITLAALLEPGDDSSRWSPNQAASIEGYVVSVAPGPVELTNCFVPGRRDTHIHVGLRPDSRPNEQVVMETTPGWEDWAQQQGWDWSGDTLKKTLQGRKVRFEGWLMFDASHAVESENISPRSANWRATAWEIHPVTRFEVIE